MANNYFINIAKLKALISDLKSGKATREIITEILPEVEKVVEESTNLALESFYGAYSPDIYQRTRGFANAWKVVIENNALYVDYLPEYSDGGYHQSTELVFENVFMKGYHGGSSGEGSSGIQWRTPYPFYKHWGRSAASSRSIFELADQNWVNLGNQRIIPLITAKMRERIGSIFI